MNFQGPDNWDDKSHVDSSWVNILLMDLNDNPPVFRQKTAHLSLAEDTPPNTALITLAAHDLDKVNKLYL